MNRQTNATRQHILDTGYELIVAKGFTGVGLSQLLKHAEVPKGSFYHYFKSKEQFGEAMIADYFDKYQQRLGALFSDSNLTGKERLLTYWRRWIELNNGTCGAERCLVVKLAAEVSDLSESMRIALNRGAENIIGQITDCIESGVQDGSVSVSNPAETAVELYQLWLGASVLYKLSKDSSGMEKTLLKTEAVLSGKTDD
ncbi:TetR/AcrR family transcriptional regulator [Vibrio sp. SCSIO 43137]|uniref:TetR/AcrR family transcriptional regulator n=1 Tax=Vibrio sp. SCSIO 43137 TaxID=3021011 RepID=UPI0023079416|nr:TetR/AcrR family transcriptional regulator [Vibrio sp. SCSIO 43137]WCE32394.1 TetR/AcrR family transcriptional regulator [Vibrio sp. SCSIO 43137]